VIADWAQVANLGGKVVSVRGIDGSVLHEGSVQLVDTDGALVLQTTTGPVRVTLGDVDVLSA
jgi:biotin protein ligase-like protein